MVKEPETKFLFVTGGVLSGVGKGITAASIGTLLKARGLNVNIQKCDPYLNVDAGTLNPAEHGECFVTADGAEADLDLGHYERFLDIELTQASSLMSGRVLQQVIADERAGKYLGKTVQIIPHVTSAIIDQIIEAGRGFDVHIVEVGGTIGDYESLSFIEAIRELAMRVGRQKCLFVHVVYIPYLGASGEFKTKPAQNAVRELRGLGIVPDVLVARSEVKPPAEVVPKLSLFSGVEARAIALLPNAGNIYQVPLMLEDSGVAGVICEKLRLKTKRVQLKEWRKMVETATKKWPSTLRIGVVAKYLDNQDTYMSVFEAIRSAGWHTSVNVDIDWIEAEKLNTDPELQKSFKKLDGVVVPGGFGPRGIEGKIWAADYAAKNSVPYLGLCLGMQVAIIARARANGLSGANSTEFDPKTAHPVIDTMDGQLGKEGTGGTMRLGNFEAQLLGGSKVQELYKKKTASERHRHRYEASNNYVDKYEQWGIIPSGRNPELNLVEFIELGGHPYFVATQAHPELCSRPNRPHPLFLGLLIACKKGR